MAVAVGFFIIGAKVWGDDTWRLGFLIGIVPALLVVVIRWKMKEPEQWREAKEREKQDATQVTGSIPDLFNSQNLRNTVVGIALATIGLVTFWGCHIYGKNALLRSAQNEAIATEGLAADAGKELKAVSYTHLTLPTNREV